MAETNAEPAVALGKQSVEINSNNDEDNVINDAGQEGDSKTRCEFPRSFAFVLDSHKFAKIQVHLLE